MKHLMAFIVLASSLLLAGCAGETLITEFQSTVSAPAEDMPSCASAQKVAWWEDWQPAIFIVIIATMFLSSIGFIVGRGFGIRSIEAWSKEELYQALASAIIVANLVFVFTLIEETSEQMADSILSAGESQEGVNMHWAYFGDCKLQWGRTGTSSYGCGYNDEDADCHFYLARAFMGSTYEKLAKMGRNVAKMYGTLTMLDTLKIGGSIKLYNWVFGILFAIPPVGGISILYESIETCFSTMAKTLMLLKFQEIVLMYLERGVFPFFMVAGVILRSIWFTRKLGGLLLAIAIGIYTIFPMMYVLSWYTMDASEVKYDTSELEELLTAGDIYSPEEIAEFSGENFLNSLDPEKVLFTDYNSDGTIDTIGLLDITARYMFISMATPLISLLVLIGFIRALSVFLGGDIEIAGLTRII